MKNAASVIFRSIILLLLGIVIGIYLDENKLSGNGLGISLSDNKLSKVISLIKNNYVDSVNVDSVEGVTVNNVLQDLDPHSLYLPPQQAESVNERLEGSFNGLGLEYQLLRDTLIVTQVYNGGPAALAGLAVGDKIIDVDKKKFSGTHLTFDRVNYVLKGEKDSEVALAVVSPNSKTLKQLTLKRGPVELSSLDAAYMAGPGVGYIKISKFALTTDADFKNAFAKLKAQGLKKLVLDLRDNGGGYLNSATALADEFLKKDKLIVYTKGIHEERKDYFATDSGIFQDGKLAVIIDEYSASASEIVAGALQDLDRAVIVGRRSFGKGLVQQQFPFGDGSAVNLTVARYYTPSGRSIQKSYKEGVESYHNEIAERMRKGELISEQTNLTDSVFNKSSPYHTLNGREVFSGGGIMPDVFVPADTNQNNMLIQELNEQQLFTSYIIDKLQPVLNGFSSYDDFIKNYNLSDDGVEDFLIYASKAIKEMDSHEVQVSTPTIKTLLKAYAARFKWGDNAYFEALNNDDVTLKKAVEAIE